MGFWEEATNQAGREFGARHFRWFVAARVFRRVAPGLSILLLLGSAGLGLYALYGWLSPDWSSIGTSTAGFAVSAGWWVLGALIAAAVLAAVVWAGVVLWRAFGWRIDGYGWRLRLRFRWSRYY